MKVLLVPSFSLSLITNIFLFLIPAVTPQVVEDDYYLECSKSYKCGSITDIKYPFWGSDRPSYCGLQGYEFKCTNYLIFNMSSQLFVVHKIERSSSTMTIARKDWLENNCSSYFVKTVMNFTLVDYGPGAEVLTLFDSCPSEFSGIVEPREKLICEDNYGIVPLKNTVWFDASQMCKNNVTIPVLPETKEGFENNTLPLLDLMKNGFEVDYERQANMITCHNCEKSGGICGTNTTTYDFTCFCKDGPHSFSCRGSFSKKPIVKISIIFGLSVIGAVLSLFWVWYLNKVLINKINKRRKEKFFKQNGGLLLQQQLLSGDNNIEKIKVFKSYELAKATNFYDMDRVLGQGGQGTVYKGMLSDGRLVAVKKSKIVDTTNIEQFINEVVILSQINHRNIVKLLGCCLETEVPMLVYEFISNGTLFQHIHNPIEEFTLTWKVRLQIAMEIAETLSYLHNAASMPIYHRDIKSTNILLDDKYKAKVSDFGISRSVDVEKNHLTTEVKGTFGYLDPEYFQSSQFTEKSDVYSFGVVLVELLTGKQPIFSNTSQIFRGLAPHFIELMEDNHLLEMIDPKLLMEDTIEDMVEVAHLAKACLNSNGKRRPTTKEIVAKLDVIRASQKQSITLENDETNDVREVYDNSSTSTGTWDQSSSEMSIDLSNLK